MARPVLHEKHAIAERLGIGIQTLRLWEKKDDFPGLDNFDAIVAWRDVHGLGRRGNRDLAEVKLEIAAQQLLKITRENEVASGKLMTVDELVDVATRATAIWQTRMRTILETETPPRISGMPIAEMRAEIRKIVDELCRDVGQELMKCVTK